jgi:hypothetical protein
LRRWWLLDRILNCKKQVDFFLRLIRIMCCVSSGEYFSQLNGNSTILLLKSPKIMETIRDLSRLGNYIHTPSVALRNTSLGEHPFEFSQSPLAIFFVRRCFCWTRETFEILEDKMAVYRHVVGIHSSKSSLKNGKSNLKFLLVCFLT